MYHSISHNDKTHSVATAISEKDFSKAMSLRDPEFLEALEGFYATSAVFKEPRLPHHQVSASTEST